MAKSQAGLPIGWASDLAVLLLGGSSTTVRPGYTVVRTPANPRFQWGNFILVTDPGAANDAQRWSAAFTEEFPVAEHVAIGLVGRADPGAWGPEGYSVEREEVLMAAGPAPGHQEPTGYSFAPITSPRDWARADEFVLAAAVVAIAAEQGRDPEDPASRAELAAQVDFERLRMVTRRQLAGTGRAAYFGAYSGDTQVGDLGIVLIGAGRARFQTIRTDPAHRRRGLASHLMGLAARWAASQGAPERVLITDIDNPARQLYRALGFMPVEQSNYVRRA